VVSAAIRLSAAVLLLRKWPSRFCSLLAPVSCSAALPGSSPSIPVSAPSISSQCIFGLPPARYRDNPQALAILRAILAEIRNTPGVQAAGSTHFLPLTEKISGSCFSPADQPTPSPAEAPSAQFLIISSRYFQAVHTPLLSGRDFDDRDHFEAPPVAIVNHASWSASTPAKMFSASSSASCWTIEKPVEIVGVVADARQAQLQDGPRTHYLPLQFASTYVILRRLSSVPLATPLQIARSAEAAVHRV